MKSIFVQKNNFFFFFQNFDIMKLYEQKIGNSFIVETTFGVILCDSILSHFEFRYYPLSS